ncbi:MAG TPA: hypothetical protein ENI55_01665 [Alphaproteobacteria bacterium]|nr:hypothetical protein [Alphaproteobacteria bacterium]
MTAALAVLVLFGACTGGGAATLHALGLWRRRNGLERTALAFATGFGVLGWILFWPGVAAIMTPAVIWAIALVLLLGNGLHFSHPAAKSGRENAATLSFAALALLLFAAVAFSLDLVEALAPPVDADTLAYHFNLPRRFVEQSAVTFTPVAFSGAAPLLVHMTYTAALAMGGKAALPLWTLVSGWMAAVLLFAFLRRWLPFAWALMPAVIFQTMPAMIYGAGSGQVEARLALFVLVAAVGLADGWRSRTLNPIALAALGAGFYAAAKLTGLLFVAAVGVTVLISGKDRFKRGLIFGLAALAAGGQWYGWNFYNSGDPVFPLMFGLADTLGLANPDYWNADFAQSLKAYLAARSSVISGFHWFFSYPVIATLFPPAAIESGRVGLGPYFLLIAPFAVIGAWKDRRRIFESPLFPVSVAVVVFYLLWIKFGAIPKPRHLLPIIPALLIPLQVAAQKGFAGPGGRRALVLAGVLSLAVNFAAQGLFSKAYLEYFFSGRNSDAFLSENLRGYPVVPVVNATPDVRRLYIWERQLQYYIKAPTFFSAPYSQALIDARDGRVTPDRFYAQLKAQKISHLLLPEYDKATGIEKDTINTAVADLASRNCLERLSSTPYSLFGSRTLKSPNTKTGNMILWRLMPDCPPSGTTDKKNGRGG